MIWLSDLPADADEDEIVAAFVVRLGWDPAEARGYVQAVLAASDRGEVLA